MPCADSVLKKNIVSDRGFGRAKPLNQAPPLGNFAYAMVHIPNLTSIIHTIRAIDNTSVETADLPNCKNVYLLFGFFSLDNFIMGPRLSDDT